jgi:hypothetical protein
MGKKPMLSRRRFLRDLGVSAGAAPFLLGLDSLYEKARAQTAPKKRFLVFYAPNGNIYAFWRIDTSGQTVDLTLNNGAALSNPNLQLSPLQPNASKILILDRVSYVAARAMYQDTSALLAGTRTIDGLDHPGGHQKGMGSILSGQVLIGGTQNFGNAGMSSAVTTDQVLANTLFKTTTKFPSLQLAVRYGSDLDNLGDRYVDKRLSYTTPVGPMGATPLPPTTDPFVLFHTLFGTGSTSPQMTNNQLILDKSVLDAVQADFTRVSTKMSKADQLLLAQHAQSVRNIEGQLTSTMFQMVNCGMVTAPTTPGGVDITNPTATKTWTLLPASYPVVMDMMISLTVQALACGLTNVVTFMCANSENDMNFPWLNLNVPSPYSLAGAHGMSHQRNPNLLVVDRWYASKFNALISQLAATPDSGAAGSVLDNSILMYTSCLGDGSSHHSDNAPMVLAGGNGGYFKTGRAIRFNSVATPLPNPWPATDLNGAGAALNATQINANIQAAQNDQNVAPGNKTPPAGTRDVSNNDVLATILDSFGLDIHTVQPTAADPRFLRGLLPELK